MEKMNCKRKSGAGQPLSWSKGGCLFNLPCLSDQAFRWASPALPNVLSFQLPARAERERTEAWWEKLILWYFLLGLEASHAWVFAWDSQPRKTYKSDSSDWESCSSFTLWRQASCQPHTPMCLKHFEIIVKSQDWRQLYSKQKWTWFLDFTARDSVQGSQLMSLVVYQKCDIMCCLYQSSDNLP